MALRNVSTRLSLVTIWALAIKEARGDKPPKYRIKF